MCLARHTGARTSAASSRRGACCKASMMAVSQKLRRKLLRAAQQSWLTLCDAVSRLPLPELNSRDPEDSLIRLRPLPCHQATCRRCDGAVHTCSGCSA